MASVLRPSDSFVRQARSLLDPPRCELLVSPGETRKGGDKVALDTTISVENASPKATWDLLSKSKIALLIDCRTRHEWETTGTPDLDGIDSKALYIEWRKQPDMSVNPDFLSRIGGRSWRNLPGAYSSSYADPVPGRLRQRPMSKTKTSEQVDINCVCVNVAEGFRRRPRPRRTSAVS